MKRSKAFVFYLICTLYVAYGFVYLVNYLSTNGHTEAAALKFMFFLCVIDAVSVFYINIAAADVNILFSDNAAAFNIGVFLSFNVYSAL